MTPDTVRAPAEASRRPCRGLRQLVPWLLALAVATCTQDNVGPSRGGVGYFSFRPVYPMASGVSLSQFGIVADSVHILLTRPVNELVLDTTVAFPADSTELRLALPVELATSPEILDAVIEISAGGVVIFRDSVQVTVKDGAPGNTPPPVVTFDYVGPGSNIASLTVLPGDTTITLGDTLFFTASAIDSSDATVPNFYVGWKTSDTLVARINAAGRLIAPLLRGNLQVIGLTPTGVADTTVVTFAPVPVIITADSGNSQVGLVADSLGALLVARVKGADSLGISGIAVRFRALDSLVGASVRDTVVITDAQGRARTRVTLGTVATSYTYTATALGTGLPAFNFTATATATAASTIALISGNAQVDTILQGLALPFVTRVTDGFGNPVAGAVVVYSRLAGAGTLADDSVTTDAAGLASVGYTLGAIAGIDSIQALLAGTSAKVTFTTTALSATPAQIIQGLGDGQSASVTSAFTDSLTVQILDGSDNPVNGVWVQWLVTAGGAALSADSTQTDALGHAAVALTAGTLANTFTVEASVTGIALPSVFNETVTAGAPATMLVASGDGQTGVAGAILPLAPDVRISDAFNNPVAGLSVDFAVTAGGGSIDSTTATTDSTGRANAGLWTLGLAGLNTVRATSTSVPADTLLFDATATPAGTTKLWTGASTTSWTDAASWSPIGVPGLTDNVFIPAAAPSPVLSSAATIAGLTIESGATLTSNALFTVSADADIGGTIAGTGTVALSGSGGTFRGTIGSPIVNVSGNHSLSGTTAIGGALNVTSGTFTINGQALSVGGNLTTSGGQLSMASGTDSVDVGGDFTISTGTTGTGSLSTGVMVLRGNFTQTAGSTTNFAPSGTHTVRFLGTGVQTVNFANPGSASSRFQNVEFGSPSGTTLNSTFTAMGIVTANAGTVTGIGRTADIGGGLVTSYGTWQVSTTLWGQDPSVYPDSLPRNVTAFNAWTLTKPFKADSNLVINSTGVLDLNGHTLRVGGTVTQGGVLRMQNTGDTLDVGKMFTVNGGTTGAGDLTGGMLRLHGGFTQNAGSTSNFQPSGSHVTRFEGVAGQSASFSSAGAATSRFQEVEFADSVTFSGSLYVAGSVSLLAGGKAQGAGSATLAGDLSDPTDLGWRFATTLLAGDPAVLPDSMATDLTIQGIWTLAQRTRISGNLTISSGGQIDLNGDTLLVSGAMTQGGLLVSVVSSALLDVGGAFLVNSGTSGTGDLSGGHLVLRQGFAQNAGSTANFAPGAGFLTTFAGSGGHPMSFSSPGVGNSTFSVLEVFDSLNVSGSFTTTGDVTIMPAGRLVGAGTGTILAGLADSSGLGYRMTSTTIPGAQVIPAAMTTDLLLTGAWSLPASFTLTGNLSLGSGADLTVNGHRLYVSGSFVQGGILRMLVPADTVEVNGLLLVNSGVNGTGHLVDGRLLLRGGLTQTAGDLTNFAPSTSHVTEFAGSGGHQLNVSSFSAANSQFRHLIVRDSLAVVGSIAVTGDVMLDPTGRLVGPSTGVLLGDLVDSSLAGWRMASTQLNGRFQSIPSALVSDVTLTDSIALAQNTSVTGNFVMQNAGYIAFSGHGLGVSGNFTQSAELGMNSTQDSLDVGGTFLVSSGSDGTGDLTAGVIVLRGGLTQTVGSTTNFMSDAPHRVRITGPAPRVIDLSTPNLVHFGDLELDASGTITLASDVRALGTLTVAGPVGIAAAAQRLLRTGGLAVDGLTLDRVRIQSNSPGANAAQFDNVTFNNIAPTLTQLALEFPGQTGDTIRFNNVFFSGTPTSGLYVDVVDSLANDGVAVIGFYNSAPLNGSLFTSTDASPGDTPTVLWTRLDWVTQPTDAIELLPIVAAPQVGIFDPSGNPVTGYTGNVTLGFFTNPSGAVLGNNSVAAVGGVATFDSLSVSLAGIGFQLQASTSDLGLSPPSALFSIFVPIPVGTTTAFNNGGGDNDWFNAANWTFGVPDSLDNVYILPGQTAAVNAPAQVNRMQVGTGGGVLLNAPLTADSSVDAGNTITGGGALVARGTGYLSGVAGGLVVTGSYLVPANDTLIADYINISGATAALDPGSSRIVAIDSLRTEAGGHLDMNDGGAVVTVQGLARFTGSSPALLAGTLEIGGDFSQEENIGAFAPAPAFVTLFTGGGTHTATFFSPDTATDRFGTLALTGGGTLHLAGTTVPVIGDIQIQGGHVVADTQALVLGTITGATGAFMEGNTLLIRGDFAFGGVYTVAKTIFIGTSQTIQQAITPFDTVYVEGNVTLAGNASANVLFATNFGQFTLGGHRLDVTADFGTGSGGTFQMTDPADTVMVGGTFYAMGGSTTGLLSDGLLQIGGNFYQGGIPNSIPAETQGPPPALDGFRASGGHTTRFVGDPTTQRVIYFGSPVQPVDPFSTNNSEFGRLELIDGIDSVASTLAVVADLFVDSAHVLNASQTGGGPAVIGNVQVGPNVTEFNISNVSLGGTLDYQASPATYQVGTTLFFGSLQLAPVLPYNDIEVALGEVHLSGDITAAQVKIGGQGEGAGDSYGGSIVLNGHALTTTGDVTVTGFGTITMTQPSDSLDIGGNFDFQGGPTTDLVTDGVIVTRGSRVSFSQNFTDTSFVAAGSHRLVMATPGATQLWIGAGPTGVIRLNRYFVAAGTSVSFDPFTTNPLVVNDTMSVNGFFDQANPGRTIVVLGDLYAGAAAGITVDTVELHQGLEIDASVYSTQVTRFAGIGQRITPSVSYNDIQVTGAAELDSNVTVGRDFIISGNGGFNLLGHTLDVGRDLRTRDNGLLTMQDPLDTLRVGYTAVFDGGDTDGLLTDGLLTANYFAQGATTTTRSFRSSGAHRVVLLMQDPADQGTAFDIASGGPADSRFNDLVFASGGTGGQVNLTGHLEVQDTFEIQAGATGGLFGPPGSTIHTLGAFVVGGGFLVMSFDTLDVGGTLAVPTSILSTLVTRFSGVNQFIPDTQSYQRLEITGTASPEGAGTITTNEIEISGNGQFTLGANQRATTSGNFTTIGNGTVQMNGAGADLIVGADADFLGGSTDGLLTAGTMTFYGDLNGLGATSDSAFRPGYFSTAFIAQFEGDRRHQVTLVDLFDTKSFLTKTIVTANDTLDVSDQPLSIFGALELQPNAGLINSGVGQPFIEVLGQFTSGPGALVQLANLGFRDSVTFDPSGSYNVGTTFFGYYTLPLPVLPYQSIHIQGGTPFLGSNITATGWVSVNGQGTTADLRLNGFALHTANYENLSGGTLTMDQSTDSLVVDSVALFRGGSELGKLVAGAILLGGDFTQDTALGQSPSGFVSEGTTVEFTLGPVHGIHLASPDSSWLPDLSTSGAGTLNLLIAGRARVAGGINSYGISLGGDTLITDGQLSSGLAGLNVTLDRYEGPVMALFQNVNTWTVGTTQFTGDGTLPSSDFDFDTLIVSANVQGQLSQNLTANYVEVTAPGNPRHIGTSTGGLILEGGDGNTDLTVSGNVLVRGPGAHISSFQGNFSASGDLTVDQDAYLYSGGSFGGGSWQVNGNVLIDGASTADSLVRGYLSIGGSFTQRNTTSDFSWAPDSGFTTAFAGTGTHVVDFASPGPAATGSHFGSLAFNPDSGLVMQTGTDLWVEGLLTTTSYANPTLQNTGAGLRTITVQDVAIQGITFDHLQLHLAKTAQPALGADNMDIVNFTNFLTTEDQFLADLPGLLSGGFSWSNFTFTQLATDGSDTGHYFVATDNDGGLALLIGIGSNQTTSGELGYYVGLGGAIVNPFSP